jgi:hypothetical protein
VPQAGGVPRIDFEKARAFRLNVGMPIEVRPVTGEEAIAATSEADPLIY